MDRMICTGKKQYKERMKHTQDQSNNGFVQDTITHMKKIRPLKDTCNMKG